MSSVTPKQYLDWYRNAQFVGRGYPVPQKTKKFNMERLGISVVQPFYQGFLIPLAYLASGATSSYDDATSMSINQALESTATYGYSCGDDDNWKRIYEWLINDAYYSTNDIIGVLDGLGVGKAWMYVLEDIVRMYIAREDGDVALAIKEAFDSYLETHDVRIVWCGGNARYVKALCLKGTNRPSGYFGKTAYVFPLDTKEMPGGNALVTMMEKGFLQLTHEEVELLKGVVSQTPIYRRLLPKAKVSTIIGTNVVDREVNIIDTGSDGVPPIEALKLMSALPSSLVKETGNSILALCKYVTTIPSVHPSITEFIKSPTVQALLSQSSGVKVEDVKPVSLDKAITSFGLHKEDAQELLKQDPTAAAVFTNREVLRLTNEVKRLKQENSQLLTDYNNLRDKLRRMQEDLTYANQLNVKPVQVVKEEPKPKEEPKVVEKPKEPDKFDVIKNDFHFEVLDYLCKSYMLMMTHETLELRKQLMPVQDLILKFAASSLKLDSKEKMEMYITDVKRESDNSKKLLEICDGALEILHKHL